MIELFEQHIRTDERQSSKGNQTIDRILSEEAYYPDEIKRRVKQILVSQKRKYRYLFTESTALK